MVAFDDQPFATAPPGARCAVHPDVAATELCGRCGSFACEPCTVVSDDGVLCRRCASRFAGGRYGSWLAIGAGILGFLGLGCAPLGPAAVVLAGVDLVWIAARRSPKGGLKLDVLGLVIGLGGTLLWAYLTYQLLFAPEPYEPYGYEPYGYEPY